MSMIEIRPTDRYEKTGVDYASPLPRRIWDGFFAARDEAWANVPACAQHYPRWCECEPTKPVGVSDTQENQ